MFARKCQLLLFVIAVISLPASVAFALGFDLGKTKEQLELEYDVSVVDHGTGRVTISFTLADPGRLKPISSVQLVIPSEEKNSSDGSLVDLSVSLATREVDGKQLASIHLKKEWAERAEIHLNTSHLDGKSQPLTWYYHSIPIARYMKISRDEQK